VRPASTAPRPCAILIIAMQGLLLLTIEVDREEDGRWIAEVLELPGVLAYGSTEAEAVSRVKATALVEIDLQSCGNVARSCLL